MIKKQTHRDKLLDITFQEVYMYGYCGAGMFELDSLDQEIAKLCSDEFVHLSHNLERVLEYGMQEGSIRQDDAKAMAEFVIASVWGILSKPAVCSSKEQFIRDSQHLLIYLKA